MIWCCNIWTVKSRPTITQDKLEMRTKLTDARMWSLQQAGFLVSGMQSFNQVSIKLWNQRENMHQRKCTFVKKNLSGNHNRFCPQTGNYFKIKPLTVYTSLFWAAPWQYDMSRSCQPTFKSYLIISFAPFPHSSEPAFAHLTSCVLFKVRQTSSCSFALPPQPTNTQDTISLNKVYLQCLSVWLYKRKSYWNMYKEIHYSTSCAL